MKEERLYIIGYMASGKTTFGEALARRLGWKFMDLDHEIERVTGLSPTDFMEKYGEARFREEESLILKSTAPLKKTVIACGGGTPCHFDNMEFMTLHGKTLWLIATPARIAERILEAGNTRPLAAGKTGAELTGFIERHLYQRQPFYARAEWRLSGEHLENEREVTETVDDFLKNFRLY